MNYSEDDLLPLSALQHLLFCERQCALIHIERIWVENRLTTEGQILHRNAHEGKPKTRDGVRITRGLPLRSFTLGVSGQADVVEWRPPPQVSDRQADRTLAEFLQSERSQRLPGWTVTPIEYKRGKPKANDCDRVQLCAQAICLEEMLGIEIGEGQIFYGQHRRRFDVEFDSALRETTHSATKRLHAMIASGRTPPAIREKKCDSCSLISLCLPDVTPGAPVREAFLRSGTYRQLDQ
jgi:CRISPR-associated exonuclease Cas4